MSKSFALAVAEANGQVEDALPFQMEGDDTQLYAYLPGEGQLVLLMGIVGGGQDAQSTATTVLEIFWSLMEPDTARVLRRRLADRTDSFGVGDVMNIVEWLVEEAAARPTQSSSASTPSRTTSGQRSTASARPRASTRSRSPRTASAT
jgi:hypothetical protein